MRIVKSLWRVGAFCAALLSVPVAQAAPAYFAPTASLAALAAYGTTSPLTANAYVSGLGNYIWTTGSCTPNGTTQIAATGVSSGTACWIAQAIQSPSSALAGSTSGVITDQVQAAAGTYNFNRPITAGTAGQALLSEGGGSTPMAWGNITSLVPTISALSSLANPSGIAFVTAYNSGGITGGGNFQYTASTITPDGCLNFAASGGGTWVRLKPGQLTNEMCGTVGNDTANDTTALQNFFNVAFRSCSTQSTPYWKRGTFKITSTLIMNQTSVCAMPNMITDGMYNTILDAAGVGNTPAVTCSGNNGGFSLTTVQGIQVTGGTAATNTGLQTNCAYLYFEGWDFENEGLGVVFDNAAASTFTEGNVCVHCHFGTTVTTAMRYSVGSGTNSFKRSGCSDCYVNQGSGPVVIVDSGAAPYQAPMSLTVWGPGSTATLIQNNQTTGSGIPDFSGDLLFEDNGFTRNLGTSNPFYFSGNIDEFGLGASVSTVHLGTMVRKKDYAVTTAGSIFYAPEDVSGAILATTGANQTISIALPASAPSGFTVNGAIFQVDIVTTNYDFKQLYQVVYNATGTGIVVSAVGSQYLFNTAGYGAPTQSVSGDNITFSNTWPVGISGSWSVKWLGSPVQQ